MLPAMTKKGRAGHSSPKLVERLRVGRDEWQSVGIVPCHKQEDGEGPGEKQMLFPCTGGSELPSRVFFFKAHSSSKTNVTKEHLK